jgi:hypothetical protein
MTAFTSPDDGFANTMHALRLLFGIEQQSINPLMTMSQFGFHGYSISVYEDHVDYLQSLSFTLVPDLPVFDADAIDRWKLINELLISGFVRSPPGQKKLSDQFPALAALAAFPTLEEVARRLSGRWDEDGKLLREVSRSDGVYKRYPDGATEPKPFKKGQRIVELAHKLQLLDLSLDPRLRKTIASLDSVLQRPMATGMDQSMSPLYERLQYFRDHWVHGRRFDGWEAILISLFLALIYFGSKRLRESKVDTSSDDPV